MKKLEDWSTTAIDDFVIDQQWHRYTHGEHNAWRILFQRQSRVLSECVVPEFLTGLRMIANDNIPDFRIINSALAQATGWKLVAVPGLVPDEVFFHHLAHRRFPATRWIRRPEQMEYLREPDIFHDVFGHVPLLFEPAYADYLAAYGRAGLDALQKDALPYIARVYWYTVEFGLVRRNGRSYIFGAGIVSSKSESIFALESTSPHRIAFDLIRAMRTTYRIDDFQQTYFVIKDFRTLSAFINRDLSRIYDRVRRLGDLHAANLYENDSILTRGDG